MPKDRSPNPLLELWPLLTHPQHLLIALHLFLLCQPVTRHPPLPWPVCFSLTASLLMFGLLFIMPQHPMAIPTAIGGGLAFALITK